MDSGIKKFCPNCSQHYSMNFSSHKSNLPLFLSCGHSMCEKCILNIVKFSEPIVCKICQREMQVKASEVALLLQNKIKLHQLFPVNTSMVGEIALQLFEPQEKKKSDPNYFIDIKAIIKSTDSTQGQCVECHNPTVKMCQQCATILCDMCFNKTHKNFIVFKNHVLQNIEPQVQPNNCKFHKEKVLEYFCKDCNKSVCMDCLVVGGEKSCKNHDVVSMDEVNERFLEDLTEIVPKVNETFKRLTKTAADIGHLLYNIENETGSASELPQLISTIEQHFSKLNSTIQKHKYEVIEIITNLKDAERESLVKCKNDVANAIKKSKIVLNSLNMTLDPIKMKHLNLAVLLDEAKAAADAQWYLKRDETNKDPLKVAVNEDLCSLVSDYIHLEGNADSVYKLCSASELGEGVEIPPAPKDVVYPQEMPRDVRKSHIRENLETRSQVSAPPAALLNYAPRYRSKHGSTTSINSIGSDSSRYSPISRASSNDFHYNQPVVQPVQPYAESYAPKQLYEGCQEVIYISHIVAPDTVFVQRASHQDLVKEMLREFRSAPSAPKPSPGHVQEGKVYAVLNKVDNVWQRCRVMSVDRTDMANPRVIVFAIDFGSTISVTADKLRVVRPARVNSPPPLAIHCSLNNVEPICGAWSSDDSILIQKIINNRQAVMVVQAVESTPCGDIRVRCDILTYERGVDLARALVFHRRARLQNPRLPAPVIKCLEEKQKLYTISDFKLKTVEQVYITHVVNPDKFFVRKSHLKDVYEKLCDELEQHYSPSDKTNTVYLPEVGMVCAVNIGPKNISDRECDGAWARGIVKELPGRQKVSVFLPDIGVLTLVHWSALRYIDPKLNRYNALATECHLAGVTPLNQKWNPRSVNLISENQGRVLELIVEDVKNRSSAGVTLWDKTDEENPICINQEMIKNRYAVSFGLFSFNKRTTPTEEPVITNKYPLDQNKPKQKPRKKITVLKRNQNDDIPANDTKADLTAKDKGPLRLEAKVLHYQSPSLLYIAFTHQQKAFNELFENMQKFYGKDKKGTTKSEWKVEDKCVCFCVQSNTWRRAAIMEIEGDNAKIFYTDFASVETLPLSSLKELAAEFAQIGNAAIKCHCSGVIPAVGDEWPSLTKEYLKELLDVYPRTFITKLGNFKNNSMPIEIWVYHTTQGDALEPNVSEWRCLNKRIIEQGLGVPDKNLEPVGEDGTDKKDDDILAFINSGRITEFLNLEPMPLKSRSPVLETESTTEVSTPVEDVIGEGSENTIFITDWLPPEPLQTTEFVGMPTYIDHDGVIYLHDMMQEETLELIRKALDVRFKDPDPKAKFTKWTVGEPCVAQFFLDKRFYRGRVTEVDDSTKKCHVHYIDYGNDESCSYENMRKCIALYQIPTQAHRCLLDRIKPPKGRWDRTTLDYIHKSIVEKQCFIKVKGPPVDGVIPIDLKYDKLCINEHLVDFEMAVYEDGSKAVIRKFKPIAVKRSPNVTLESDSGPDYIVEDDEACQENDDSSDSQSIGARNWVDIVAEEEDDNTLNDMEFITFPEQTLDEFTCNISCINKFDTLELNIIHDENMTSLYENLFKELQQEAETLPKINGIYENKACIALFDEDKQWYRASILEYSEAEQQVKVKYVDYGNIEIVSLENVKEISQIYAQFPPSNITAKLFGVTVNLEKDIQVITDAYADVFLDKGPFNAKVITYDPLPCVELRNDKKELVYEGLLIKEIFLKIKPTEED